MTTMTLTAIHEGTDREIGMMVGKAMCAFANWRNADEAHMERAALACQSEYEATVRCIGMLVRDSLPAVCSYVMRRAAEMADEDW